MNTTRHVLAGELRTDAPPSQHPLCEFVARAGSVPGTAHVKKQVNNQDAYVYRTVVHANQMYHVGIVSDGCTGSLHKSHTEIGAGLLTLHAFSEIRSLLTLGVPVASIPDYLYTACVNYVGVIARSTVRGSLEELQSFIENFFLCTLVGFVAGENEICVFQAGDGFVVINDDIHIVDENDRPSYPAYHHFPKEILAAQVADFPGSFTVHRIAASEFSRLAIGTDGLVQRHADNGELYIEGEERNSLFAYQRSAPAGLQWWLNKQQNRHARFTDDTTVITLVRKAGAP